MTNNFLRWLLARNPSVKQTLINKMHECADEAIISNPHIAAKFYPYEPEKSSFLIKASREPVEDSNGLPLPPRRMRYHELDNDEKYLSWGKELASNMVGVLDASGFSLEPESRILDFGCADGFMLRHFYELARTGEAWGVDITGRHMMWCQQNLSPPFKFATTTSFPHLPFEDRYFSLVYAGSVFTHIVDMTEAWLLELRRIVRPGGNLYLTVHDRHTIDIAMMEKDFEGSHLRKLGGVSVVLNG